MDLTLWRITWNLVEVVRCQKTPKKKKKRKIKCSWQRRERRQRLEKTCWLMRWEGRRGNQKFESPLYKFQLPYEISHLRSSDQEQWSIWLEKYVSVRGWVWKVEVLAFRGEQVPPLNSAAHVARRQGSPNCRLELNLIYKVSKGDKGMPQWNSGPRDT